MAFARCIASVFVLLAGCGGGDDDGTIEETTPLLELPPRIARACSVVSPTTQIGDGLVNGFALVGTGGRLLSVTTSYDFTGQVPGRMDLAELQVEPVALSAPLWSSMSGDPNSPVLAAREGGGVAIAWSEHPAFNTYRIAIAAIDATGAQIGATRYMDINSQPHQPRLVARPGGFAIVWSDGLTTRLQLLDNDAVAVGQPTVVQGGVVIRHGDGFVVAWMDDGLHAVLLDASGNPRGAPQKLAVRDDRRHYGLFAASVGDDVLLAWEEHFYPTDGGAEPGTPGGTAIVRIARLKADGTFAGAAQRLQAAEPDIVNVNPTILSLDGAVAVSWSRGHYIAICGGCMSDNDMQLVELDPTDLAPISNVTEFGGPSGLRSAPIQSLDGRDIAYLLAIDRHARFDFAGAMVRCTMQ